MKRAAFTILELLVAIIIIGMIIAAGAAGIQAARISSRDTQRAGDLAMYSRAIDQYLHITRDRLPIPTGTVMTGIRPDSSTLAGIVQFMPNASNLPKDPLPADSSIASAGKYTGGYVYDQYVDGSANTNAATYLKTRYAFTAGFERKQGVEGANLVTPPFSSQQGRSPFSLPGSYCGNECY